MWLGLSNADCAKASLTQPSATATVISAALTVSGMALCQSPAAEKNSRALCRSPSPSNLRARASSFLATSARCARPSPFDFIRSANQSPKKPPALVAALKATRIVASICFNRSSAPALSVFARLMARAQHSRPPCLQVSVSSERSRYASTAFSANVVLRGLPFSQTRSQSRAFSQLSSTESTISAKNRMSASKRSSGTTDRRSWNTAKGLKGSFGLDGESIIEQASASSQSTFPCSLWP